MLILASKFETHILNKFVQNSNRVCTTPQNKSLHRTLDKLQKNDKIKICKYDEGRGVAILDKEDYFGKLDSIIDDSSKFERINVTESKQHPVITKEASISYYVRKCFKSYGKNVIDQVIPSGSSPGKLYGRIKIHKKGNLTRPVVSMINTSKYNLAKFFDKLIKPYLPKQYILDSTSHFIEKLKQFPSKEKPVMVSFDVVPLFTNVPLTETINLIADYVYAETIDSIPPFTKDIFIKLMNLATKGLFFYKKVLYQQIDGVTMGSPLGPTLANFFMANLENKSLKKESDSNPKLHLQYVDDIFAIFEDKRFNSLNS